MTKRNTDGILESSQFEDFEDMPSKQGSGGRTPIYGETKVGVSYKILRTTREWIIQQSEAIKGTNFLDALYHAIQKGYISSKVFEQAMEKAKEDLQEVKKRHVERKYTQVEVEKMIQEALEAKKGKK